MAVTAPANKARSGKQYTIIGVVLAIVGFGFVLAFGIIGGGGSKSGPSISTQQQNVVVAARDINLRTSVTAQDITIAHYSVSDVPPGTFANTNDVKNLVAAIDIKKGQAITSNLVAKDADVVVGPQSAYLPIPSGFVALTIPTSEQQGVAGYIQAGDYISMIAVVSAPRGSNVRTVFNNVHVLKIGPAIAASAPAQASSAGTAPRTGGVSSSLTVIVSACQAEYINWFLANAAMRYTLESYKDYKPQDAAVDQSCPSVQSAQGVRQSDVANKYPGIFNS